MQVLMFVRQNYRFRRIPNRWNISFASSLKHESSPESVPINSLVVMKVLIQKKDIDSIEMIGMIATAEFLCQKVKQVKCWKGELTKEAQILCFQSGANSIFMEMNY